MVRIGDISIKVRLYAMTIFATLGLAGVLTLALWCLFTFRVNGPVYNRIVQNKDVVADILPPPLFLVEAYLILHQIDAEENPAGITKLKARFEDLRTQYDTRHKFWSQNLPEGDVRHDLLDISFAPAKEFFRIAEDEYLPLRLAGKRQEASKILHGHLREVFDTHRDAIEQTVTDADKRTKEEEIDSGNQVSYWSTSLATISFGSVAILGLSGWWMTRSIVRSTRQLMDRVEDMAGGAGDLTARIDVHSRDEMGRLATGINHMMAKIQVIVLRIREGSVELLGTTNQIAATAHQQEGTVQGLSTSTVQIASAVQEISANSKALAQTMNEVNGHANHVSSLATTGKERLIGMEQGMQQLIDSTSHIAAKLATIRDKTNNISTIVTTITKVADQTNLLSVNAAIEAEKAGAYGRGFLVVSREIRRLADQTAVATLNIEEMVRSMQEAVADGVLEVDKFNNEVRVGVDRVDEINHQTEQIIEEVQSLSTRFAVVNDGMGQQSIGAQQISEAMMHVSSVAKQTQASLKEFNEAAAHVRHSVEILNQEVSQFKV